MNIEKEKNAIKTYAMDFFNKFPNAQRLKSGVPEICIERVYNVAGIDENYRDPKCEECWNREMKEDE